MTVHIASKQTYDEYCNSGEIFFCEAVYDQFYSKVNTITGHVIGGGGVTDTKILNSYRIAENVFLKPISFSLSHEICQWTAETGSTRWPVSNRGRKS